MAEGTEREQALSKAAPKRLVLPEWKLRKGQGGKKKRIKLVIDELGPKPPRGTKPSRAPVRLPAAVNRSSAPAHMIIQYQETV